MAKQAGRLRKLLRRVLRFKGLRKLLRGFWGFQGVPKTCHVAVSKPNRNSLWGLGRHHDKASGTPSQAAAEGFAVQRPSKAAAGLLKLLRGAQTCHVAVSKPNRNSLWGLGRYHGKASGTPSQAAAEGFAVQRHSKAAAGLLRLLRGAQNVPRSSFEA